MNQTEAYWKVNTVMNANGFPVITFSPSKIMKIKEWLRFMKAARDIIEKGEKEREREMERKQQAERLLSDWRRFIQDETKK